MSKGIEVRECIIEGATLLLHFCGGLPVVEDVDIAVEGASVKEVVSLGPMGSESAILGLFLRKVSVPCEHRVLIDMAKCAELSELDVAVSFSDRSRESRETTRFRIQLPDRKLDVRARNCVATIISGDR